MHVQVNTHKSFQNTKDEFKEETIMPNGKIIEHILDLNQTHSADFVDPSQTMKRRLYTSKHPTRIAAAKCMDGRINLPVMTGTPVGHFEPWRNLGGIFNLGWPTFKEIVADWVNQGIAQGRKSIPFCTYHWAKGDPHRGCRGHNYDLAAARDSACKLKMQFHKVFGKGPVYAILCGIETDDESLFLHGDNGKTLDIGALESDSREQIALELAALYPDMPIDMIKDLVPLVIGNMRHVAQVRRANRPITEAEHRERVLCVGRGFDWMHEINLALIIGHYDPRLAKAIATGAKLIYSNLESGRVSLDDGVVLMTSAPHWEQVGYEPVLAAEKALFLREFSMGVIQDEVPELIEHLKILTATVDMNTRKLSIIQ